MTYVFPAGRHSIRILYHSPGEILGCRIAFAIAVAVAWLALLRFPARVTAELLAEQLDRWR